MGTVVDGPAEQPAAAAEKTRAWSLKGPLFTAIQFLVMAVLFGVAYTQAIQFNDNQNTKFLHGIAESGWGYLKEDWLANTADPLPVFSALVRVTYALNPNLFYAYYILLFGVYIFSLMGIASLLFKADRSIFRYVTVFAMLLALHSFRLQQIFNRQFHFNLQNLQFGLAGQYILGTELQNSTFGAFILLSIYMFLRRRYAWSGLWLALACVFHSAYLFGAAFLTLAYLAILFFESLDRKTLSLKSIVQAAKKPFWLGLLVLVPVLPLVWYNQAIMSSTDPQAAKEALYILVHLRIPHHSLPEVWLTREAYFQVAWMLFGLLLVRKSRLFWLMLFPMVGGLLMTLVQMVTGSDSLALLAPWRVSVFLVPLATMIVAAWAANLLFTPLERRLPVVQPAFLLLSLVVIALLVQAGVDTQKTRWNRWRKDQARAVMNYVRENKAPGEIYLVPTRSNKFDDFRLYTGAPILINWKSHPYQDFEVLDWYARNQQAEAFYNAEGNEACSLLGDLALNYQVTQVVLETKRAALGCGFLEETYHDKNFTLYKINP